MTVAQQSPIDAARLSLLAERVLQVDASSPAAQRLAAQLSAAATATGTNASRSRVLIDSAATGLTALLKDGLRPAAPASVPEETRRLQALLDAALRDASRTARSTPDGRTRERP